MTTLYHSAPYIDEFYRRASLAAKRLVDDDYEVVMVNDGSPDSSLEKAIRLTDNNPQTVVIDLSRNFGHHKAMMTGLMHTKGEHVFLIDSDLEEEPEWLLSFSEQMAAEGCDMVYGIQRNRRGGAFERFTGAVYYSIFRALTGIKQPNNIVTARLMTRRYVQALTSHQENEINFGALAIVTGFKQSIQFVTKHSYSPTTYRLSSKLNHFVNAITSFSSFPLIYIFYVGLILCTSSVLLIGYLLAIYLLGSSPPSGYLSLIISIWFFSGLITLFLGIQGIYLSKVFSEVKRRPYAIIRHVYRNSATRE